MSVAPDLDDVLDSHLPAVVIGYQIDRARSASLGALAWPPPWLMCWQHQYGGYATEQAWLMGLVAPLAHAPGRDAARIEVLEGLAALASGGPRDPEIRRFPSLPPLHLTFGTRYAPTEIATLASFLATGLDLPPITGGCEAFVELEADDLLARFAGWPIVAHEIPRASHLADPDAGQLVLGPPDVRPARHLDARLLAALEHLRREHGIAEPPRAYLLWMNSD